MLEKSPLRLRRMKESDLRQVLAIENRAFPYPWPGTFYRRCLRSAEVSGWVLEQARIIQCYGVMALVEGNVRIMNLCVRPESQARGLGSRMLTHMLRQARGSGARRAWLEVRPSNYRARTLYKRMGFTKVGTRKAYYPAPKGRENALIMARRL